MNLECTNKFSILCVNDPEENVTSDLETHFSQKNKTKKAKGKPLSKGPLKRNVIDEKIVCTLKTDPVISRCKGCFQSHFPYPKYCRNSKITSCKIERRKKVYVCVCVLHYYGLLFAFSLHSGFEPPPRRYPREPIYRPRDCESPKMNF